MLQGLTEVQKSREAQVQYRTARLCARALFPASEIKLENDSSWESILSSVDFLSLSIFHKIYHNLTRPLLSNCMPVFNCKMYNTRAPSNCIPFKQKTQYFIKNIFFSMHTKFIQ